MAGRVSSKNELSHGSRTEVEQLNQQETPGDGNRFPGSSRTISGQVPQGERTQQELRQVNTDRHDQGGGGSSRSKIHGNIITAEADTQNVGMSDFHNVRGPGGGQGGGHDICGNTITAGKGASQVGIHNFGNQTSHVSAIASGSSGGEEAKSKHTPDKGSTCCIL